MDHFQFFPSLNADDPVPVGYVNASTKQLAWNYDTASAILHDTTNAMQRGHSMDGTLSPSNALN